MSLDDIDIDSWGKPKAQATADASAEKSEKPAATSAKGQPRKKKNREPVTSRSSGGLEPIGASATVIPVKILDDAVLLASIEKSSFNMEGEQYFRNWVTRKLQKGDPKYTTGKARTAVLAYLVKIYRKLKNEGYE